MSYDPYTDPLNTLTGLPMATQEVATELIGPWFAGWIAHMMLFGCVQSQFSAYTSTGLYREDPLRTKLFLWAVVLLDLGAVCVNASQMYHFGTAQVRDYNALYAIRAVDAVPNLLCSFVGALVQLFLLRRASTLFSSNYLLKTAFTAVISFLILMAWLAGCGTFILGVLWPYGLIDKAKPFTYNNLTGTWLWTALAVDTTLATTLIILVRRRFDTNSESSAIRQIIAKSIETASYTVVLGLAGAIVGVSFPQNNDRTANVPLAFTLPLPSLYALSMVVTLSSRKPREPALVTGTVHVAELKELRAGEGSEFGVGSGVSTPMWRSAYGGGEKRRFGGIEDDLDEELDGYEETEEEEGEIREERGVQRGGEAFVDIQVTRQGREGSGSEAEGSSVEEKAAHHLRWA